MIALRRHSLRVAPLFVAFAAIAGCEEPQMPPKPPPVTYVPTPPPPSTEQPPSPGLADTKPSLDTPKVFDPPAAQTWKLANGMTAWLVERHALPMVSVSIVVPYGAGNDPKGKWGLAHITADMLDEGAGTRSAVELSTAIADLGAHLETGAGTDGSLASLTVLKKNWKPAFGLLADVVARPRFDAREWKRVSDLWKNDLKKRADDPQKVARVVMSAVLFGPDTPYGHPTDGRAADAKSVDLGAVKAFYKSHWRPDQAILVAAGDITRAEIETEVAESLGAWKSPADKAEPAAGSPSTPGSMKLVLVDRPDAPQSVIGVVRSGLSATDPTAPYLDLVNTALGGSFTSRLNQNLREDHGWTYGAASRVWESRYPGAFFARAAVRTDVTGVALKEMLGELTKMADAGPTDAELVKTKAQDRGELVQTYENASGIASRLGTLAILGLPTDFDRSVSQARQAATLVQLKEAAKLVDPRVGTIVVVGPRKDVEPQLQAAGLPAPELRDTEGFPVAGAAPVAKPVTKLAPPAPKK